jgi:hypothetical protein
MPSPKFASAIPHSVKPGCTVMTDTPSSTRMGEAATRAGSSRRKGVSTRDSITPSGDSCATVSV